MIKFKLTLTANTIAAQIADLLNKGGQLLYYFNENSVLQNKVQYLIELDGDKVVGVIGLEIKTPKVTEIKHLCVHPDYRRKGLGKKLLELAIRATQTKLLYGTVREDNHVNIRNNFRVGMTPIGKFRGRGGCNVIVFARRKHGFEHRIYGRRTEEFKLYSS